MEVSSTLINEFLGVIANVILFSAIPLLWYIFKERTLKGFIHSLGIYQPQSKAVLASFLTITPVYLVTLMANVLVILLGYSERSSSDTQSLSLITFFLFLTFYGMKTGIAEEIFFRGFIAKKLIKLLGYSKGNFLQAIIFAFPHFVISGAASTIDILVRIANAFLLGYTFGYLMDKKCDGSIVPVMTAHVLANMTSTVILLKIL